MMANSVELTLRSWKDVIVLGASLTVGRMVQDVPVPTVGIGCVDGIAVDSAGNLFLALFDIELSHESIQSES